MTLNKVSNYYYYIIIIFHLLDVPDLSNILILNNDICISKKKRFLVSFSIQMEIVDRWSGLVFVQII